MSVLLEAYHDLQIRLNQVAQRTDPKRGDPGKADAIRDAMDCLWYAMGDDDHNAIDPGNTSRRTGPHRLGAP